MNLKLAEETFDAVKEFKEFVFIASVFSQLGAPGVSK